MKRNKHSVPKKVHHLKYIFDLKLVGLFSIFLLFIGIFLTSGFISSGKQTILPAKAEDCSGGGTNDDAQCDQVVNPCHFSCNIQLNGNPVFIPSCCDEIEKTGDPMKCCFGARRMCTPKQCSTIPGDVKRQRCAQLWELNCCPTWTDACGLKPPPEMLSLAPVAPTSTPIPTNVQPTVQPTAQPTITPTQPVITVAPTVIPTSYISPTEPIHTVTPPQYLSPTRPYNPNPTPTYYFPPTNSFPTESIKPTTDSPQPTTAPSKPIINLPNPEPVIRKVIKDTGDFIQKMKNSLEDFFRVVLP